MVRGQKVARECLSLREKYSLEQWSTFSARALLGRRYSNKNSLPLRNRSLLSGCEGLFRHRASIPFDGRPRQKEAAACLVRLYELTGRPTEAAAARTRLDSDP